MRRRLLVLGVVAVLLAAAAVTDALRERRQAGRLADVPGLVAPLGPSVGELWRHPAGWGQMTTIGGDVVVGRTGTGGREEIVGVDGATGATAWVTPVPELSTIGEIWCESLGDAARRLTTHVVCLLVTVRDGGTAGRGTGSGSQDGALMLVIDARTGERVTERRMESRYPALESLGEDLAVVEVLADSRVRVVRVHPDPWTVRWTFRSTEPLPTAGRFRDTPLASLQRDVLLVTGGAGWALSPQDGTLLEAWDLRGAGPPSLLGAPTGSAVTVLPDGRFAVARQAAAGGRTGDYGTVREPGGAAGFAVPGPVLRPEVDDGSAPDVLLTVRLVGGDLTAQDAATGERLWAREGGLRGDTLLLDGRLVGVTDGDVTALDVRTGAVLWQVPVDGRNVPGLVTDGRVVAAGVVQPDGRRVLVAWGAEDGRERWRAPLPAGVAALRPVNGRLLAFTGEHVVALGDVHADRAPSPVPQVTGAAPPGEITR